MNYRNKLMNLSLIALAVFSACSDEVENGTHPGKGDQRLSFAVSMGGTNAWKPTAGTRAASGLGESTYELSVSMRSCLPCLRRSSLPQK